MSSLPIRLISMMPLSSSLYWISMISPLAMV